MNLAAQNAAYAGAARGTTDHFAGDQVQIEYWEDPKLSELIARAGTLPPDTVVLDMAFARRRRGKAAGRMLSSTRTASEALGLPIYSCWETLLSNGIVGGMIRGGFQQGEAAAERALQVLRGADPDSLPVVREGTSRPMSRPRAARALPHPGDGASRRTASSSTARHPVRAFPRRVLDSRHRHRGAGGPARPLLAVHRQPAAAEAAATAERGAALLALASTASGIWEYFPKTRKANLRHPLVHHAGLRARRPSLGVPELGRPPSPRRPGTERSGHPALRGRGEGLHPRVPAAHAGRAGGSGYHRAARWWSAIRTGSVRRIVGTHVDISERKRTQAELEQANLNLERRVSERTRELVALNEVAAVVSRSLNLREISESRPGEDHGSRRDGMRERRTGWTSRPGAGARGPPGIVAPVRRRHLPVPLRLALAGKQLDAERPSVWPLADYPEGELKQWIQRGRACGW